MTLDRLRASSRSIYVAPGRDKGRAGRDKLYQYVYSENWCSILSLHFLRYNIFSQENFCPPLSILLFLLASY